jgi:hypothetical protein
MKVKPIPEAEQHNTTTATTTNGDISASFIVSLN